MNTDRSLSPVTQARVFQWAVGRREPVQLTFERESGWVATRSNFLWFDEAEGILAVRYPDPPASGGPMEASIGETLGASFRRGHKKCVFSAVVVGREQDAGGPRLLLRPSTPVAEYQRRSFMRAAIPPDRNVGVALFAPPDSAAEAACRGRLRDISAGGLQMELPGKLPGSLRVGQLARIEIGLDAAPLYVDGVLRHATAHPTGRIGLGFQFVGLEATPHGQAALARLARLVSELRAASGPRQDRDESARGDRAEEE